MIDSKSDSSTENRFPIMANSRPPAFFRAGRTTSLMTSAVFISPSLVISPVSSTCQCREYSSDCACDKSSLRNSAGLSLVLSSHSAFLLLDVALIVVPCRTRLRDGLRQDLSLLLNRHLIQSSFVLASVTPTLVGTKKSTLSIQQCSLHRRRPSLCLAAHTCPT